MRFAKEQNSEVLNVNTWDLQSGIKLWHEALRRRQSWVSENSPVSVYKFCQLIISLFFNLVHMHFEILFCSLILTCASVKMTWICNLWLLFSSKRAEWIGSFCFKDLQNLSVLKPFFFFNMWQLWIQANKKERQCIYKNPFT